MMATARRLAAVLPLALLGVLCIAGLVHAAFTVEMNSLKLVGDNLNGDFEAAIGNFGLPSYGGRLRGTITYPTVNKLACEPFGSKVFAAVRGTPQVVLVDRGDCFFAKKIYMAQEAGASAVLVADTREEPLVTMDAPTEDPEGGMYVVNITVPSALITKSVADKIKASLAKGAVQVTMDWSETLPHPDSRVEWELWGNSNQACGVKCDKQLEFIAQFAPIASDLEQNGFTQFTPHYITWYCPNEYSSTLPCDLQCIRGGRYCAPDPEGEFDKGYDGKDVVAENLRELCVFKQAKEMSPSKPWLWWSYLSDFNQRCKMSEMNFNASCAERSVEAVGLNVAKVRECMGPLDEDKDHPLLNAEQDAQVGKNGRSDVTILPTVVINERQYRGLLEKKSVLKAICAGFQDTTEPPVCMGADIQTKDCEVNNGGCWQGPPGKNYTACVDTFHGKICKCPTVGDMRFEGDGYNTCEAVGPSRCDINNGGCWSNTVGAQTFSACLPHEKTGCTCPTGFTGDGVKYCDDVDECKTKCRSKNAKCQNTYGSFVCTCKTGPYDVEKDWCIGDSTGMGFVGTFLVVVSVFAVVAAAGFLIYKYRLRQYMDSEIRAIMAQYMVLPEGEASGGPPPQSRTREAQLQAI